MKVSFKEFFKEYWELFLVCLLLPIVVIIIFCWCYCCCLEQGTIATIVFSTLAYFGTIIWGVFIYYKSWVDKNIQIYKDRPILDIKASLNLDSQEKYFLYNREEVSNILKNNVLCCGLKQTEKSSVRYIYISIVNFGTSILSDISIENIIVKNYRRSIDHGFYGYFSDVNIPKTLTYKDVFEMFIAIDTSVLDSIEGDNKNIDLIIEFNNNITDRYRCIINLTILNRGSLAIGTEINKIERSN